jgi:hypothetical protein
VYVRRTCAENAARLEFLANLVVASLRDRLTTRSDALKLPQLTQEGSRRAGTAIRGWIRLKAAALSESGWQRYAAVAIVLASALIEIFVFGGANALLVFERSQAPALVQHGAAESFIEPTREKILSPRQVSVAPDEAPTPKQPANRASAGRKPPSRSRPEKEQEHLEARVAKRVVTYRLEAKTPEPAQSRVSDSSRNAATAPQLNVKWEN